MEDLGIALVAIAALGCSASTPPRPQVTAETTPTTTSTTVADAAPATDAVASTTDETDSLLLSAGPLAAPENWPATLPWVTVRELAFESLVHSSAGDVVVGWSIPGKMDAELATGILSALKNAGYDTLGNCDLLGKSACKLSLGRRRAMLYATRGTSLDLHLLPPNLPAAIKLPGRCVKPPAINRSVEVSSSGVNQDGERFEGERTWSVQTERGIDLDSDGTLDVFVPSAKVGSCPWEIPRDVYIMRGACGHRVGTVTGRVTGDSRFAPIVKGLREVTTTARWARRGVRRGIPVSHTRTRRYVFSGRTLRLADDDDQTGRCHHCATQSCIPAKP